MSTQNNDQEKEKITSANSEFLEKDAVSVKKEESVAIDKVLKDKEEDGKAVGDGKEKLAKSENIPAIGNENQQVSEHESKPTFQNEDKLSVKHEGKPETKIKEDGNNDVERKDDEDEGEDGEPASLESRIKTRRKSKDRGRKSEFSKQSEVSNNSFTDLVSFNEEGHPYIDINRLIYRPTPHHGERHHHSHFEDDSYTKEKLWWYLPDFAFIVFNILSICVSTYFCLVGSSTLTWKASMGMFSVPPCWEMLFENSTQYETPSREEDFFYLPCRRFTKDSGGDFSPAKGYNFHDANSFPILRTKLTEAHYFGLILICIELINAINVVVGINACLQGYKSILIQHIIVDVFIVLGEFVISAVVAYTSICDPRDVQAIREVLKAYVHWYGATVKEPELESDKEKQLNTELDALQLSLGCCGVDGWIDYLAARFPLHDWYQSIAERDASEMVIPRSCCKAWWVRNLYCSHGVHLWTHPLASKEEANRFEERIVQEGCMYKLERLCINIQAAMGHYGFLVMLVHLVFIGIEATAAGFLIRTINNLIRLNKKLMKRKEMFHDEDDESEVEISMAEESQTKDDNDKKIKWSKVSPPTEDEILTIKQRSKFNTFMCKMKGGIVGKWIKEAQDVVTEGHEEPGHEDITAEERKQREKELLHSNKPRRLSQGQAVSTRKFGGKEELDASGKGSRGKMKQASKSFDEKKGGRKKSTPGLGPLLAMDHHKDQGEHPEKSRDSHSKQPGKRSAEFERKHGSKDMPLSLTKKGKDRQKKGSHDEAKKSLEKDVEETEEGILQPTTEEDDDEVNRSLEEGNTTEPTEDTTTKRFKKRKKKKIKELNRPRWQGTWFW